MSSHRLFQEIAVLLNSRFTKNMPKQKGVILTDNMTP